MKKLYKIISLICISLLLPSFALATSYYCLPRSSADIQFQKSSDQGYNISGIIGSDGSNGSIRSTQNWASSKGTTNATPAYFSASKVNQSIQLRCSYGGKWSNAQAVTLSKNLPIANGLTCYLNGKVLQPLNSCQISGSNNCIVTCIKPTESTSDQSS